MSEVAGPKMSLAGRRWEDLEVGQVFAPIEYAVTQEAVNHFVGAVGADHPWYHGGSPYGFAVVPPALVLTDYTRLLAQVLPPITGMHARHRLRLYRPIPVGVLLRLEGTILDRFIRRGHRYVVIEYRLVDASGEPYMTNQITTTIAGYIRHGTLEKA